MYRRLLPLVLLATITIFYSCKKEIQSPDDYPDQTLRYLPLTIGKYIQYDVDSTIWEDFRGSKTIKHFTMRYTVNDTARDLSGNLTYNIDVQQLGPDSLWHNSQVINITPTASSADVIMNNLRFKKLIFPIRNGKTWQGNRAIDTDDVDLRYYGGWVYKYSNYGQPYDNGRVNFPNTVIVDAIDDTLNDPDTMPAAYAERSYMREVYGYDVGLIYREFIHWTYDPGTAANAYRNGVAVTMRATSHN